MRLNFNHILFAVGLTLTASAGFSTVRAQDANFPASEPYDPESSDGSEKIIYAPVEGDLRNVASKTAIASASPKDSTAVSNKSSQRTSKQPAAETTKSTAKQEEATSKQEQKDEDDSILSFNFLYYMFQKFKMSDMIDQN